LYRANGEASRLREAGVGAMMGMLMVSFRVQSLEVPAQDLKRIALELLDDALEEMRSRSVRRRPRIVHDVRKRLKETRAVIRLLARNERAKRIERRIRDVGRQMSAGRDADSVLAMFHRLRLRPRIGPEQYERILQQLTADRTTIDLRPLRARVAAVREDIARFPAVESPRHLSGTIARSYRGARRRMDRAVRSGDAEDFHAWRKRAKEQWYQATLLSHVMPELSDRQKPLHALSRALGSHHDVSLLIDAVARHRDEIGEEVERVVVEKARTRLAQFEEDAIVLGGALFAESPKEWKELTRVVELPTETGELAVVES
jgi:hypothetical protein